MKYILKTFIAILFLSSFIAKAAEPSYMNYDWEKSPKVHDLNEEEKKLPEVILKEKQAVEFIFNSAGELMHYELYHKITKVNSDNSIESNNRFYIPSGYKMNYVKLKARVITPNGKVVELNEKDIKEGVDEKSKRSFKYFAIEGLVLGSELEILYFMQRSPSYAGTTERLQEDVLKKNVEFEIISPSHIYFVTKSYNGLPEFAKDTNNTDKNVLFVKVDKIPALKEEDNATYNANKQQFIYKIGGNRETNVKNIISYGNIASNLYKEVMAPASSSIDKKIKKLVQQINIKYARDEEDKIRMVEQYIKRHYAVVNNPELDDLNLILDKKVASNEGIVKLFCAVFNHLKIDYQVVLTCSREQMKFDPQFEAYNFLTDYLIYVPSIKKYLSPEETFSSLGFIPHNLTNNYGLFIKKVDVGGFTSGVSKVQFIDPLSFDKTFHKLDVSVDFTTDIIKPKMKAEQQYGGYYAQYYQPYFSFIGDDDKKNLIDDIMKNYIENLEEVETTTENGGMEYFGISPFIVKASFTSENIVEKAGNNYLFKVGELIGRQMEMYEEHARVMDVENDYNRNYHREINFEIPAGFKIANLGILNMDYYLEENGERMLAFTSKYTLNGRKVTVIVDEYYKKISLPVSQYQEYRKVINAAADFNKLTLLIEKEN